MRPRWGRVLTRLFRFYKILELSGFRLSTLNFIGYDYVPVASFTLLKFEFSELNHNVAPPGVHAKASVTA